MTRVLIADDHEVVRDGVRGFLERHTNYVVVAKAVDGEEAIAKAIDTEPDVALLDYSLPSRLTTAKQGGAVPWPSRVSSRVS